MSKMQTRSKNEVLSHTVLFNQLILENVFQNLRLEHIIALRLVCKEWDYAIKKQISKNKTAVFSYELNQRMIGDVTEDAFYFDLFKITKVQLGSEHSYNLRYNKIVKKLDKIFLKVLKKCGTQVKELGFKYAIALNEDLVMLRKILSFTPNVDTLEMLLFNDIKNFSSVFKDFCHPQLRILRISCCNFNGESKEAFLGQTLKCFPNLEVNFDKMEHGYSLPEILADKKVSMKLRQFEKYFFWSCFLKDGNFLKQLSPQVHGLTILKLWGISNLDLNKAQTIYQVLHSFSSTLKIVTISIHKSCMEDVEISMPPLPFLRKLHLETSCDMSEEVFLTYNLGKRIGKDYPLLNYFTFKPIHKYISNNSQIFKQHWTSCKRWHPIVPLGDEGFMADFDLSPLKFLKFVDLEIPPQWTKYEENREWCKMFLDVYLKIYGNAGRKSIQHIVDWLA